MEGVVKIAGDVRSSSGQSRAAATSAEPTLKMMLVGLPKLSEHFGSMPTVRVVHQSNQEQQLRQLIQH